MTPAAGTLDRFGRRAIPNPEPVDTNHRPPARRGVMTMSALPPSSPQPGAANAHHHSPHAGHQAGCSGYLDRARLCCVAALTVDRLTPNRSASICAAASFGPLRVRPRSHRRNVPTETPTASAATVTVTPAATRSRCNVGGPSWSRVSTSTPYSWPIRGNRSGEGECVPRSHRYTGSAPASPRARATCDLGKPAASRARRSAAGSTNPSSRTWGDYWSGCDGPRPAPAQPVSVTSAFYPGQLENELPDHPRCSGCHRCATGLVARR